MRVGKRKTIKDDETIIEIKKMFQIEGTFCAQCELENLKTKERYLRTAQFTMEIEAERKLALWEKIKKNQFNRPVEINPEDQKNAVLFWFEKQTKDGPGVFGISDYDTIGYLMNKPWPSMHSWYLKLLDEGIAELPLWLVFKDYLEDKYNKQEKK